MIIDRPGKELLPELLQMWKTSFGDHDGFWELFLDTAFDAARCRCVMVDAQPTAALCWFDCSCHDQKLAYLYAVVTHPAHRNQGLCRMLLEDVHHQLTAEGYAAALLVPAEEGLREMYRKLGYRDCTAVSEFSCTAGADRLSLRAIGPGEYAFFRRMLLPEGGVLQEGANLTFLARQAQFYAGSDLLLAAYIEEDTLHAMELLGNRDTAPGITAALGCTRGEFRAPGQETPFAMAHPLISEAVLPNYFGFAFD